MSAAIKLVFAGEYSEVIAIVMLRVARDFAQDKPTGAHGWRHGSIYIAGGAKFFAHWTRARMVVVTEGRP